MSSDNSFYVESNNIDKKINRQKNTLLAGVPPWNQSARTEKVRLMMPINFESEIHRIKKTSVAGRVSD